MVPSWEVLIHPTYLIQIAHKSFHLSYIIYFHVHDELYLEYILTWLRMCANMLPFIHWSG